LQGRIQREKAKRCRGICVTLIVDCDVPQALSGTIVIATCGLVEIGTEESRPLPIDIQKRKVAYEDNLFKSQFHMMFPKK
jgi:hypothetical protein